MAITQAELDYINAMKDIISLSQENLEIAKKTYDIEEARFSLGLVTAETLIDTEEDYFDSELNLIRKKILYLKF